MWRRNGVNLGGDGGGDNCTKEDDMDGIIEMLKNVGTSISDWLLRIFNRCIESSVVPEGWKAACIVPIYTGKGDRRECANYRGINILSIPGKIYGLIRDGKYEKRGSGGARRT